MLDVATYRAAEALAKTALPSWRFGAYHRLELFTQVGFPIRIESLRELVMLLDTMQENRFGPLMSEWQGLTEAELDSYLAACREAVLFQLAFLPGRRPVVPLSTLMSSFTIYRKLARCNPQFARVLEIGPGCGYLSFFLKRHPTLANYSQIEVCESFYLLQNLVNLHCFGTRQDERAIIPEAAPLSGAFANPRPEIEISPTLKAALPPALSTHYPWWRIGEVRAERQRFDFVTVNAAIMEIDPGARDDYLTVIAEVLKEDGAFLMQCPGMHGPGDIAPFLVQMHQKGFAALLFDLSGAPSSFPATSGGDPLTATFVLGNALFVKRGHPLFERYHTAVPESGKVIAPEEIVRRTFFAREGERKLYASDEILARVEALFGG